MDKERIGAIFVGAIMIFSIAGFATTGLTFTKSNDNQQEEYSLPTIVSRPFTGREKAIILNSGRVVIESVYNKDCGECKQKNMEITTFTSSLEGFIYLSSVENSTEEGFEKFQMIGSRGEIIDLENEEITPENLIDLYCDISIVQPRECLLKEYISEEPPEANETPGNDTSPSPPV